MPAQEGKLIQLDPESVAFLEQVKAARNLATDKDALSYCFAEAALSLSTPEDWEDEDGLDAAEVLAEALAHPETLRSHEEVFATLRREMAEEKLEAESKRFQQVA